MEGLKIIGLILMLGIAGCSGCAINPSVEDNEIEKELANDLYDEYEDIRRDKSVIRMIKSPGGVYEVPIEVNGSKMNFIFDTGAGIISISTTEANFLIKQGTLSKEDIVGVANFSDANGDVSEGMIVRLKTIKIGNRVLKNVEASIVDNDRAPLLLGQSALSRFGKFTVDYSEGIITFEK